jgi:hypothetical protein
VFSLPSPRKKPAKKKAKAVVLEPEEEVIPVPVSVRTGCICPNQGRAVNGNIYIDPCCKVHYAELEISAILAIPKTEVTEAELEEWRSHYPNKKRVSYPRMTVSKQ